MSYLQLITLFFLLTLLNSSFGYKVQKNNKVVRRRSRDVTLNDEAQKVIDQTFTNVNETRYQIRAAIQSERNETNEIRQAIALALNRMVAAGVTNITNATQWNAVQKELEGALKLIINAYTRFKDLHQQVCNQIDSYAQGMITKYRTEIYALKQMFPPSPPPPTTDPTDDSWRQLYATYSRMTTYAWAHQATLQTAADCPADLTTRVLIHQTAILNPSTTTSIAVQISPPTAMTLDAQTISIPCATLTNDNGNQACSNSLVDTTLSYANNVCSCVRGDQIIVN